MDEDIEELVKHCSYCQKANPSLPKAPLHSWEWPSQPWSRLHLDFAGPFMGHMYLLIVDAHSKWVDVHIIQSITSEKTIEKLRSVLATHGLPKQIVTDNGTSFTSDKFQDFVKKNGIKHTFSAPYHSATNGQAERAVQTFKQGLREIPHGSVEEKLMKFLFKYRITPHSTTGIPPAELLMGCRLRSRLNLLHPDLFNKIEHAQVIQKSNHNLKKSCRTFVDGDSVYAKNFTSSNQKWIPGIIDKVTGPLSYVIKLPDGSTICRYIDHLKARESQDEIEDSGDHSWDYIESSATNQPATEHENTLENTEQSNTQTVQRSERIRKPPDRYTPSQN